MTESLPGSRAATLAACLTVAAGLIHLVAAPEHLQEWWGYGYFFLAAGIGQVLYGQFFFRPVQRSRAFYASGLLGTLAIIGLYVVTRTIGIPLFGPDAGQREAVSALDIGSKIVELALIVVLGWLTVSRASTQAATKSAVAPVLAPAVVPLDALAFDSPAAHRSGLSRRAALLALGGGAGLAGIWAIASMRSGLGHLIGPPLAAAEGSISRSVTPAAGGIVREYELTAGVVKWQLSEQPPIDAWTYNGQLPGPEIRAKVGDVVRVNFKNDLPEETTLHWHGVDVPNAMDGVPDLTQKAIPPGGTFTYQFVVGTAGTFWYHSHVNEMTQVRSGLYGPFIVEPRDTDTRFDREQTLVLADFGNSGTSSQSGSTPPGGMGGRGGMMGGSGGMMGNPQQPSDTASAFIINGKTSTAVPELTVRQGERIRLRLINASASADYFMRLDGHQLTPVATDGHDLPQAAAAADLIRLSPAERVDVLLVADHPGVWALHPADPAQLQKGMQMTVRYEGQQGTATVDQTDPRTLTLFSPDQPAQARQTASSDRTVTYTLSGNMMGSTSWTINGRSYPDVDPTRVKLGQRIRLRVTNMSMEPHPMHLHGQPFDVVTVNGRFVNPLTKDTLVLDPMGSADLVFKATNPGSWLFHCHNFEHMMNGLATVIQIS